MFEISFNNLLINLVFFIKSIDFQMEIYYPFHVLPLIYVENEIFNSALLNIAEQIINDQWSIRKREMLKNVYAHMSHTINKLLSVLTLCLTLSSFLSLFFFFFNFRHYFLLNFLNPFNLMIKFYSDILATRVLPINIWN